MNRPNAPQQEETTGRPSRKRRRKWPWIVAGVVVLIIVIAGIAGGGGSTATPAPDAAATPAPAAPISAAPDTAVPVHGDDPVAASKAACSAWESGVDPVLTSAVQSGDLAPAIRVSMGEDPNDTTGTVSVNAPWTTANSDAILAASDDTKYQPIVDAIHAAQEAVTKADPGGDLSSIGAADKAVLSQCQKLHAA